MLVGSPAVTTDYIGSVIKLSTLPTGGREFPSVLKGLAQGVSCGVGRFSRFDSWNQTWYFWGVTLLGSSPFLLRVSALSVLQSSLLKDLIVGSLEPRTMVLLQRDLKCKANAS